MEKDEIKIFQDLMKSKIKHLIPDNLVAQNLIATSVRAYKNIKNKKINPNDK
jgi:hypothetical protein